VAIPEILWVVGAGLAVGLWAQFQKQNSFKYQIGGELAIFVLLGPLLTLGAQMAMGGGYDPQVVWLGCLWGWAVLFVVHLRNFRNILPSLQAGFSNTVNWLGFDKARRLLALWWGLLLVFNFAYFYFYNDVLVGAAISSFLLLASIPFVIKMKNLSSPVGSDMKSAYHSGVYLFLLAMGLWILQCLWSLT
jgi:1,4-dihydroxy-2-naphthoate octaprenyltransferase